MTRRLILRVLVYGSVTYLVFWALTCFHGPKLLDGQVLRRLAADSVMIQRGIAEDPNSNASKTLAKRIEGGPQTEIELLACPAPFVFKVWIKTSIGTFKQGSGDRWFIYTPWKIYAFIFAIQEA